MSYELADSERGGIESLCADLRQQGCAPSTIEHVREILTARCCTINSLAAQLRARENAAKSVAPRRVPPSHKGVTYRDGAWWNGACRHASASAVVMNVNGFTDDDHAPLLALRDAPPVDPVVEFLRKKLGHSEEGAHTIAPDIRALIAAESFAPLTPQQHEDALGAKGYTRRVAWVHSDGDVLAHASDFKTCADPCAPDWTLRPILIAPDAEVAK